MRHGDLDLADVGATSRCRRGTRTLSETSNSAECELIRRARAGDERAFATLVERHRPRLEAVAWRLTRDADVAREVAHDAVVRLHAALHSFDGTSALATWLFRIVVNLCHDRARLRQRDRTTALDDVAMLPHTGPTPDEHAEATERTRIIDGVVHALPSVLRETVVLRYSGGLSYQEIAETLGCAPGTVASRIHRALRVIALMLHTKGITEDSL